MDYKRLSRILGKGWTQKKGSLVSVFEKELKGLPEEDLKLVISAYLDCFGKEPAKKDLEAAVLSVVEGESAEVAELKISTVKLASFLACLTMSEYRLGDLTLHPADLRFQEMKEISKEVRLSNKDVLKIDSWWQDKRP